MKRLKALLSKAWKCFTDFMSVPWDMPTREAKDVVLLDLEARIKKLEAFVESRMRQWNIEVLPVDGVDEPIAVSESQFTDGEPSFTAVFPHIQGCRGQGNTKGEAILDLYEARLELFKTLDIDEDERHP